MANILIVEDESSIADSLIFVLKAEGFSVLWKQLASKAYEEIQKAPVDLIILDVGLPDMSGFELCKQIRKISDVPVMFLTSRAGELDRVIGLEIGADDYVVKPFSPREVTARVKAILKRTSNLEKKSPTQKHHPENKSPSLFRRDPESIKIFYCDQLLQLTPLEYKLLSALIESPNRVLSRDQLLNALGLSTHAGYDRSVDTHIKSVRAKLREINPTLEPIQTQRGFGYVYQPNKDALQKNE